jgi:hypothetical protein
MKQLYATYQIIKLYRWRWLAMAIGFTLLYYTMVLVFTMIRFQEIPNYVSFENVFHVYYMILAHTPSLSDAIPIMANEAFFETGFKDPNYYGVATWSYMLIPPKVLLVLFMAMLLTTYLFLKSQTRRACRFSSPAAPSPKLTTTAGLGTALVSLTNVSLSWVVCCATPNWSVALTMLGLSSSISLWLNPYGVYMTLIGIGLMLVAVFSQAGHLSRVNPAQFRNAY